MADPTLGPKSVISMIIAFFECIIFGIVTVGWPNLVYLYKEMNLFPEVCPDIDGGNATVVCPEVDRYYNICFTVTELVRNSAIILWGLIFDKYGILVTRTISV